NRLGTEGTGEVGLGKHERPFRERRPTPGDPSSCESPYPAPVAARSPTDETRGDTSSQSCIYAGWRPSSSTYLEVRDAPHLGRAMAAPELRQRHRAPPSLDVLPAVIDRPSRSA